MQKILSQFVVGFSKFKVNPHKAVEESKGEPVAVLLKNKPVFYVVSPEVFERLSESYEKNLNTPPEDV